MYIGHHSRLDVGLREATVVHGIEDVLFCEFAVHSDFVFFIAHFIELFVSELALTA